MLVSDTQKCDSVIHILIHASILLQVIFPFRLLHNNEQSSLCYIVAPYLLIKCCGQFYNIGDCYYSNQLWFRMQNLYPIALYLDSIYSLFNYHFIYAFIWMWWNIIEWKITDIIYIYVYIYIFIQSLNKWHKQIC